jgi:hypothetical protein
MRIKMEHIKIAEEIKSLPVEAQRGIGVKSPVDSYSFLV